MNSPVATVLAVNDREALVQIADRAACPRCAAGKGCGAGLFAPTGKPVSLTIDIRADLGLGVGDKVELSLAPRDLLRSSLFAYGAPLGGLVIAAGIAYLLVDPLGDGLALGLCTVGLLSGGAVGRMLSARDQCIGKLSPSITRRVGSE